MFWKATSMSRSFLHSTSCGVMFWYPLGTHLSRKYPSRFSVQFLTGFWSVLEHCGPKLSPWGYPKWSDDKDIQGKRHFGTILGALKFSARSDKMSWRNLNFHFWGGTSKFPPNPTGMRPSTLRADLENSRGFSSPNTPDMELVDGK